MKILIIIILVLIPIYLIFIKNGRLKQGIGELNNGDFYKARISFWKVLRKNPRSFKAHFYMGNSYKDEAFLHNSTEKLISLNKEAIYHYIRAVEINPDFEYANNMIEHILVSINDKSIINELIKYTKEEISKSDKSLKKEFNYIYNL